MSTTLDSASSISNRQLSTSDLCGVDWKRDNSSDALSSLVIKRPRYYYYRLESESSGSRDSDDDTESIYSIQDKETDIAKDTSDTDTKSEGDYDVAIEFEVASSSESEHERTDSSSGSEGPAQQDVIFAVAAAAIANNIDEWVTDCEDSDNSSVEESSFDRLDFSTCIQCHGRNDHPLYRYCEKCFQNRKRFLPPRPKRFRKSRLKSEKSSSASASKAPPVKLATLRHCLSGLSSQDSGLGSSQECPPLDLDRIVVPDHLTSTPGTSKSRSSEDDTHSELETRDQRKRDKGENVTGSVSPSILGSCTSWNVQKCRKRQISESSLSDFDFEVKRPKLDEKLVVRTESTSSIGSISEIAESSDVSHAFATSQTSTAGAAQPDLCIFCNNAPQDTVFMHTNMAHCCCCYPCAKKTLNRIKRCPICNRPVNKIVKLYRYSFSSRYASHFG